MTARWVCASRIPESGKLLGYLNESMATLGRQSGHRDGPTSPSPSNPAGDLVQGDSTGALPRLAREKVTPPERIVGYFDRPVLLERIRPTRRVLTVLKAPGGFGKTTVLAEACRNLRQAGVLTAWLTLDVLDMPHVLDSYLTFAFQEAGLNLVDVPDARVEGDDLLEYRTALLLHAIRNHGAPCVLALDELERVAHSDTLTLLDFLVRWSPPNLHLAIACRELPAVLDIASRVFDGRAALLTVNHLRFSQAEVGRFLGSGSSRRDVASLARQSGGWPIALRILQNEREMQASVSPGDAAHIAENWVKSRLWRDLSESDRELLLDVGLFEWIDAALLDEVLEGRDLKRRVDAITAMSGLIDSVRGRENEAWRLHPLIREHCANWRLRETPDRFRSIHRRIAGALARRGETVAAIRHAAEAGDMELVAEILENVGGVRLWLREGLERLQAADQFLTAKVMDNHPRLALAHCIVLIMTGRLDDARRIYRSAADKLRGAAGDSAVEDIEMQLEEVYVRGLLCLHECESFSSERVRKVIADHARIAEMRKVDPLMRGHSEFALCIAHQIMAEFDAALDRVDRAERCLGGSRYVTMFTDLHRGQIAMARGQVSEATNYYARAQMIARSSFLNDPASTAYAEILMRELDLERNRFAQIEPPFWNDDVRIPGGTPYPYYAAAAGIAVEMTLQNKGIDAALANVEERRNYAFAADMPMMVRYLAALRVSLLALRGRIGEADRAWRLDGLPDDDDGCLDLESQSWREMEAIACARLRLLLAREEFDVGRRFAGSLVSVAAERGLRRTCMRGLALWVAHARNAGRPAEAEDCLVRFLRLFAETDYARPLVRESESCLPVLEDWLERNLDESLRESAERLLNAINGASEQAEAVPHFSRREMEVLQRLEAQRDKEIAAALGLSEAGVRYRIGRVFAKLGVRGRRNAVHRARQVGLLPDSRWGNY